jgi:hypothetical protein
MSNQSKISQGISDAYFTSPKSAQFCTEILRAHNWINDSTTTLEPCVGAGSLAVWLPGNVEARDIHDYGYPHTILSDYLTTPSTKQFDLVFTNPPFGRAGSIATKIFNRATQDTDRIAMILPTSFRKISLVDRLNQWFHPVVDDLLPCQHFLLPDGTTRKVNTVFQMWERRNYRRGYYKDLTDCLPYIKRVHKGIAEFAIRTQGSKAGKILEGLDHSPASTAFCVGDREKIEQFDWTTIASFTAGIPAIGLRDIQFGLMLNDTHQNQDFYLKNGLVSHLIKNF